MAQKMSDAEQENIRAIVSKIATHIVEGSAAIQELKSIVARLKNIRCDVEYAIHEHWLKAAKIIEAAGKDKSSWARFMNSLNVNYGNDKGAPAWGWGAGEEGNVFSNVSRELWAYDKTQNFEKPFMDHSFVEPINCNQQVNLADKIHQLDPGSEKDLLRNWDSEQWAPVAVAVPEPDIYKSRSKRKWDSSSEGDAEGGKTKNFVQFTNGRKLGGEQVFALKKSGKCFYCERKGHRAVDCKDNPDLQGKL